MWLCGNRCGLVGGSMSLGWALEFQKPEPVPVSLSLFLLPMDLEVQFSTMFPVPGLLASDSALHHDEMYEISELFQ